MKTLPLSDRIVLIVEDAYLIALEAQRIVEEAGARRVMLASNVEDVRRALAAEPVIDLCVLDLKLGEEDATPLINEIVERGIRLIVATGFDCTKPVVGVPLLKKPYQETELVDAIRTALPDRV